MGSAEKGEHLKRGKWSVHEDERLKEVVAEHGSKHWPSIADRIPGRSARQCCHRWRILPDRRDNSAWTPEEDKDIWDRALELGRKWTQISKLYMPSRTSDDIKTRWKCIIRK